MHGNSLREGEIASTVIIPTGKSGGLERVGHRSPVQ